MTLKQPNPSSEALLALKSMIPPLLQLRVNGVRMMVEYSDEGSSLLVNTALSTKVGLTRVFG